MRFLFLLLSTSLLACSSSSSGGPGAAASIEELDSACIAVCDATARCRASFDVPDCQRNCKAQNPTIAGKIRSDWANQVRECELNATCAQPESCQTRANKAVTPTDALRSYCDAVTKKSAECKESTVGASSCLEGLAMYTDSAVNAAQSCLGKSCSEFPNCVKTALALL